MKSEQTELTHVAALVTHYALAHPEKHFELHSATQALLTAPGVSSVGDRLFQIFGRDVFQQMIPVAAEVDFARAGIPGATAVEARCGLDTAGAGFSARERVRVEAGAAEAQSQLDLHLRERALDSRPSDPALVVGGVPQHPAAYVVSRGASLLGDAAARGGCERASGEDRGALPAVEFYSRFSARCRAHGADEGAACGQLYCRDAWWRADGVGADAGCESAAGCGFGFDAAW